MLGRSKTFLYLEDGPIDPLAVDSETVESWMTAAEERDTERFFEQMDHLLSELKWKSPFRVYRLRRDIPWLCKQATRRKIKWGK